MAAPGLAPVLWEKSACAQEGIWGPVTQFKQGPGENAHLHQDKERLPRNSKALLGENQMHWGTVTRFVTEREKRVGYKESQRTNTKQWRQEGEKGIVGRVGEEKGKNSP